MALLQSFRAAVRSASGVAVAVFAGSLALVLAASRATGPAFDELERIAADSRARELVRALSDVGVTATVSSAARTIYEELSGGGLIPALISGSFGDALSHSGVLDRLTGVRFGWLLVTALAPVSLFLVVEAARGVRAGILAACLLVALPRWTHAAAVASEPAVTVSLWLAVVAAYVRSVPPTGAERRGGTRSYFRWTALGFAVVFGAALATSIATLWVVPFVVAHYFFLRGRETLRLLRRGAAPLPSAFLWSLFVSPCVVLALTPKLWRGGAISAAEWLFLPLGPTIHGVRYKEAAVTAATVPPGYAIGFFLATIPVLALAAALFGIVVLGRDAWQSRSARSDRIGLLGLVAIGLGSALVGPTYEPDVFLLFPPRVEAALPWVAAAGAVGIEALAIRVLGDRGASAGVIAAAFGFMAIGLVRISTASASFGLFSGGTRGALAGKLWSVGDGSEVAVLARAIDALRLPRVSLRAADVPRNYFTVLSSLGRISTRVDVGASGSDLVLVRGPKSGALATADQAGATLWSLARQR